MQPDMTPTIPERFPLTAYQLDIWVTAARVEDSPQYNAAFHERLVGNVDQATLLACVEAAVQRNDAVRLRFDDVAGTPCQWVDPQSADIDVVDLSGESDPATACRHRMYEAQQAPLPLRNSRMFRALLLVESPQVVHLYMVLHHLVTDGWSLNELSSQILRDYAAATHGLPSANSAPPPYRSFAQEEAAYRASDDLVTDRAAHLEVLADATPVLFPRLTTAGPRQEARYSFTMEGSWVGRVRAAGLPVFPYIAAMVGTYLCRVHRSDEVLLGIPLLNRPPAFRRTVGQFANALPLRVAPRAEPTVRDLAAGVRTATDVLRKHERAPLGDVLRALPTPADAARQLFDVQLSYLRVARPENLPGIVRETSMTSPCHEQDALSIVVLAFDDTDEIRFDLAYARDVFDADYPIESVARHVGTLLHNGIAMADRPVSEVSMLPPQERDELIVRGRGEVVRHPDQVTVPELFQAQVRRRPDQIALVGPEPGCSLTYAELDTRANQVARALRADGVGAGDRVAVLVERGPDLLAALLGILTAGAAYVPVDPEYPAERIKFLLADSDPAAVLVSDRDHPALPGTDSPPVRRVADLMCGDSSPVETTATAADVAYVIYTSGSTGRPKGVEVQHRSVVNRLAWMQRRYPLGPDDRLLQKTPVSFDVSVWELFWWAVEGASLALLPPGGEKDPRMIHRAVQDHRVTVLHSVPSMLGPFLDVAWSADAASADCGTLRLVFCSGEALPPSRVDRFNEVLHRNGRSLPALVNLYGPTETTVDVTFHDCPGDPSVPVTRVPIGRPVDNTTLYVVGPDGLQPGGVPGELYVGGVQVARGYLGRPELTAERFVPDPFGGSGPLYRTGDLVRWLADGSLEYLGRLDGQVKIRGNRVELGEVTSALLTAPGVRDALVVDRTSGERATHLVGYYVADGDVAASDVRRYLSRTLPDFMVPAYLVPIDRVPLTPNGKADRRALPAPAAESPIRAARPLTPAEAVLAGVWSEVLGSGPVAADDNFFALGGDSLLMLRVRALAEEQGLRFSVADLMQYPTIASLVAHAVPQDGADGSGDTVPQPFALISGVDRARLTDAHDAYPLTRMQLGLIYHSRRHEKSAVYKDVFHYTLSLRWDEPRFRHAFARLMARHPVLRTTFQLVGFSEPLQVVHATVSDRLDLTDLRGHTLDEANAEIRRHIGASRYHDYTFDQTPPYLFRVHIRDAEIDLVLRFHHALLDGASVAILVSELLRDYTHALGQHSDPVPDTPLPSTATYVQAERRALESVADRRYWTRRLEGAEPLALPAFRPHEPATAATGAALTYRRDLPPDLAERLRAFAHAQLIPVKSVLFAAHCLTLSLLSGTTDVTTGLITHGRPELANAERLTGLFLNTLPMRVDTAADTWIEVGREAFRREQEAYPHRRYPLSAIQENSGRTVVDTAFNYVRFEQLTDASRLPGVKLTKLRTAEETNFTLLVNAVTDPIDEHLWLRLDGDGRVVTDAQLRQFGDHYANVLDRILRHPQEQPGWDFLTVKAPVHDAVDPRTGPGVLEWFTEQAARTPDTVAVATATEQWTYARLEATANAVAGNLRDRGVTPGATVAVALERSPELIAVFIGTLLAGAAVLPLDTRYPSARLADMTEQAKPACIVTTTSHDALFGRHAPLVRLEDLTAPQPGRGNRVALAVPPESIAYLLFTSGSTGRPKGVAMPHRALSNLVSWQNRVASAAFGVTLQYAPLSFDVSFQEIFSTLCNGGTLRLVDETSRRDMPALLRLMDRERVERVFLPYVALQQLAAASNALGLVPRGLRVVISSGEQLRITEEIRQFCSALPGVLLENQYGPTETHVVTHHTMSGPPADYPELPPIGTAIDGAHVHVLDARLRPVPPGVTGELYVGGACLAEGYPGRDDLTAERFLDCPPYGRLYRTGDVGFTLPDGDIVCSGRADSQVKIRGFRVETAEVELAIGALSAEYPGIEEAAVVARARPGGDMFLAAFLTGDPSTVGIDTVTIRLRESLPEYMVPQHVEWLAHLPSTPSGKRDDAALRSLPLTSSVPGSDHTPPSTGAERILADVLADLLHLPTVGVHDDIFALGATSLTAMRLAVTIEQRFGTRIPLSEFVAAPTVADIARRVGATHAEAAPFHPLVPIKASGSKPPLFLVHPMGGNVLCYLPLARRLPADQPLYALQAAGADPGTEPLRTIEDLADSYLEAIREVQPHGPYAIGGWSFGGFVAFEATRRLRQAGERVDQLILLDTVALNPLLRKRYTDEALLGWFFWELLWTERGGASPLEDLPGNLTSLDAKFAYIARCAAERGVLPKDSSSAAIRRLFHIYRANWQATLAYRPGAVDQDLTLLRAREPLPDVLENMHGAAGSLHFEPTNGWNGMTDGHIEVIDVPGDHLTMMEEPRVSHLADTIAGLLRPTSEV